MKRRGIVVGAVVAGVVLAAAVLVTGIPSANTVFRPGSLTDTPSGVEDGKAPELARIDVDPGEFDRQGKPSMEIRVDVEIRGYENLSYEDVQLCLYDSTGHLLSAEQLGRIYSPSPNWTTFTRSYSVEPTIESRPKYIVVDHPGLRNDSRFLNEIRVWDEEHQAWDVQFGSLDTVQDRFQFPRSNSTGVCG